MRVMKFGGTSVIDAQRMRDVYEIITSTAEKEKVVVVLSAMKGTTENLIQVASIAAIQSPEESKTYLDFYKKIRDRHLDTWKLLANDIAPDTRSIPISLQDCLDELEESLQGIYLLKEFTIRTQDLIMSFGERLSCIIFSEYITLLSCFSAKYVDTRNYIKTDEHFGSAGVLFDVSYKNLKDFFAGIWNSGDAKPLIPVLTGFIAATADKITTTLGRNGSDYSAALIGAALDATQIEIWTDVDGVLSADPRVVDHAFLVPSINYNEAMELSYFGAKVIHPQTVVPAIEKHIPIIIKNTLKPYQEGTKITTEKPDHRYPITGIASVNEVGLVTIEGAGISGNFYFLPEVFEVFASKHIQPLMITQSSSEHSISFVLNQEHVVDMARHLEIRFEEELSQRKIQSISKSIEHTIISVIGSHMKGTRGLAGRIFGTMGTVGINVIAIAQGSNEINVSFVIDKLDKDGAVRALHHEFFGV